jgi:plastocyanin
MKTRTMIVVGIAVAVAVGLTLPFASAYGTHGGLQGLIGGMMGRNTQQQQSPLYPSMMGNGYSYGGGMMGQGGMMGGQAYGGMMGSNYPSSCYQYMQNFSSWSTSRGDLVIISGYSFHPASLTVGRGTTVAWTNMDFVAHTVTSGTEQNPTNLFDSHELSNMQSFSYTFTTPGVYQYFCDIHPGMVGTITVT